MANTQKKNTTKRGKGLRSGSKKRAAQRKNNPQGDATRQITKDKKQMLTKVVNDRKKDLPGA